VIANPFDLKAAFLAKHAQHVVVIHFPIALFISAVVFDLIGQRTKLRSVADATYYNLLAASLTVFPALVTGVLAWQFQLEGQRLKGTLLLHLLLACLSSATIWLVTWIHFLGRRRDQTLPTYRLAIELVGICMIAVTGHLGGFLSGVNGPG
jgi:uncharacterized membrane protein